VKNHPTMAATGPSAVADQSASRLLTVWSAWGTVILGIAYSVAVLGAGAASGEFQDPYWAVAEILALLGAPIMVGLTAAIHYCTPVGRRTFSLMAFGWMLITAGLTSTVHLIELTVARRPDIVSTPEYHSLYAFQWPSLLNAMEICAWNLFLGLSLLFLAFAFPGGGKQRTVRQLLIASGVLVIAGLIGPAVGDMRWRLIGVFGYGIVFPIACIMIGLVFKRPPERAEVQDGGTAANLQKGKEHHG
jgi:hypothetical protein